MFRSILLALFLISSLWAEAHTLKAPYQHTATVKEGEGVFSLLRRFSVNTACNQNEFYRLNKLDKDDHIIAGKEYVLPITIFTYDGQSIRTTIKKTEWERAVKIKEYNEKILAKGTRKTHYADSKILWVPYHLMECYTVDEVNDEKNNLSSVSTDITPIKQEDVTKKSDLKVYKIYNLFGDDYKEFEVVDQSLKGKVYYIVAGHGGPDPGAMCTNLEHDLCEDEYAYDVSLRLARNLMQHGAQVEIIIQDKNDGIRDGLYLPCDRDEKCNNKTIPLNQKKRLAQRVNHINSLYAKYKKQGFKEQVVVVLHVDAASTGTRKDVFFYHHKNSKTGKRIAWNIHNTFKSKYEKFQKGRGYKGTVSSRGLYLVNYTHPPTVFIELANIQNPADQKRILLKSNRQALANWLFEGLIAN